MKYYNSDLQIMASLYNQLCSLYDCEKIASISHTEKKKALELIQNTYSEQLSDEYRHKLKSTDSLEEKIAFLRKCFDEYTQLSELNTGEWDRISEEFEYSAALLLNKMRRFICTTCDIRAEKSGVIITVDESTSFRQSLFCKEAVVENIPYGNIIWMELHKGRDGYTLEFLCDDYESPEGVSCLISFSEIEGKCEIFNAMNCTYLEDP